MKYTRRDEISQYRATGPERLAHLADFLDTVPNGVLTFARWYGHGRGCAVGLAAANDVWLQAQGLTLADHGTLKECRPVYNGRSEWPAVAQFFDLSLGEALELFTTRGYRGNMRPAPREVARKIRAHLAAVGAEQVAV